MKVCITGITGQDASYLAELLLHRGHEVHGTMRRSSTITTSRINHLLYPEEKIKTYYCDLLEGMEGLLYDIKPDIVINLAAQSQVRVSFDSPLSTFEYNALGPLRILEAIRRIDPKIKYYQASSSEMFGLHPGPQHESTPMWPSSPYGAAKLASYHLVRQYRMGYKMFASNGILFNHESERRGKTFVTAKIIRAACRIKMGLQDKLVLGNLTPRRDFGHSADYCNAIYKIMMHDTPDDFCVATGFQYSIQEFMEKVFELLDLEWQKYVTFDPKYLRPVEVPDLLGDATKIRWLLGWTPKIGFDQLVQMMLDSAMEEEKAGKDIIKPFDFSLLD